MFLANNLDTFETIHSRPTLGAILLQIVSIVQLRFRISFETKDLMGELFSSARCKGCVSFFF